ncbi:MULTISPECIES: TraR/DksA family transcriptional regulator [unclassified Streptomyces]|uniref:TraR/DksA family transcriptional regulator n=1 Tax=unclassified Streptomyces TaxID=2593676 RepID=UPI0037F743FC
MVAKKSAAKKTAAKRAAEQAGAEKAAEAPVKRAAARKATAGKSAAGKSTAGKTAAGRRTAGKTAATQTGAETVGAKKTVRGRNTAAGGGGAATAVSTAPTPPEELAVRPGEEPWTPEEVAEARSELAGEIARLSAEITASEAALAGLMRDSGDGAGDDDADTGTKNITREHEMSLAANAREMLEQTERALLRLDAGTYGLCEICGKAIGKARMQAFPRATLCVEDKQKQERRG